MKKVAPKRRRNPVARELLTNPAFRPQTAPSALERAGQRERARDGWSRTAKHKGEVLDDQLSIPTDDL